MNRARRNTVMVPAVALVVAIVSAGPLQAAPSDGSIKFWIQNAITQDPHMDTASSQVDVNSGIVTLSGTVNSLASKKYAILEAQKIEWWQRTGTRSQGPILSDEDLRAAVQAELSEDSRINPTDMNVTAELGHVTLMGTVRIQVEGYKYPWSD